MPKVRIHLRGEDRIDDKAVSFILGASSRTGKLVIFGYEEALNLLLVLLCYLTNVPVAQLDRASASEAEGRRFDSNRARFSKSFKSKGKCAVWTG